MFAICRQFQSYFNEEREMSLKTMAFCKTMIKSEHIPEHCKTLRVSLRYSLLNKISLYICVSRALLSHSSVSYQKQ